MAEIITVYGERRPISPPAGRNSFTLEQLQEAVGGDIELVDLPSGKLMVINEYGKIEKLLANIEATKLCLGTNNLDEFPGVLNDPYRRINGDVVVCEQDEVQ